MENNSEAKLLRILISSTDKFKHKPLYEVLVYLARRYGLAGATVFKGVMGFGSSSRKINTVKLWEISEKLPMVIEIIDDPEKIEKFFQTIQPYFEKLRYGCIITIEKANVVMYKTGSKKD
jgi:uncharacterized protein